MKNHKTKQLIAFVLLIAFSLVTISPVYANTNVTIVENQGQYTESILTDEKEIINENLNQLNHMT